MSAPVVTSLIYRAEDDRSVALAGIEARIWVERFADARCAQARADLQNEVQAHAATKRAFEAYRLEVIAGAKALRAELEAVRERVAAMGVVL